MGIASSRPAVSHRVVPVASCNDSERNSEDLLASSAAPMLKMKDGYVSGSVTTSTSSLSSSVSGEGGFHGPAPSLAAVGATLDDRERNVDPSGDGESAARTLSSTSSDCSRRQSLTPTVSLSVTIPEVREISPPPSNAPPSPLMAAKERDRLSPWPWPDKHATIQKEVSFSDLPDRVVGSSAKSGNAVMASGADEDEGVLNRSSNSNNNNNDKDEDYDDLEDFPGRGVAREVAMLRRRYEEEDEYERLGLEYPFKHEGPPQPFDGYYFRSKSDRRYYDDDDDYDDDNDEYGPELHGNSNRREEEEMEVEEPMDLDDVTANQNAEMFCQTAMSLDMDNAELMFNLMYFGEGHIGTVGNMLNCALEETVALHSENNTPYKLKPVAENILSQLQSDIHRAEDAFERGANDSEIQCSVCRGEIEVGESYTRLPRCKHLFHSECIMRWFKMQSWCPICRTAVDDSAPWAETVAEASNTPLLSAR